MVEETGPSAPADVPSVTPVILSGGSGTRLWPLSRTLHPKQFLRLTNSEDTLLSAAVRRNNGGFFRTPVVISHHDHRFLVAEEVRRTGQNDGIVILEPEGRNTAPAAIIGALAAAGHGAAELVLLAPSDHVVRDLDQYRAAVTAAAAAATAGAFVTFGVVPSRPETGYGWLKRGDDNVAAGCYGLEQFIEKPELALAQAFLADRRYLWNSGMFLFRADRLVAAAEQLAPAMLSACRRAYAAARIDGPFLHLDAAAFHDCPQGSFDTVIMERVENRAVVPIDIGWNDLGSWQSLWEASPQSDGGNVSVGDVVAMNCHNSLLWTENRLLAAVGVEDLAIVATADAVLVCPRAQAQDVKPLVEEIKRLGRPESHTHVLVHRPWGTYESFCQGDRFQVKRLVVNPGRRLSIQLHHHRSEHWIVVRGTARILNGDKEDLLFENQSTYIAAGSRHRLENPGIIPLELIEIQTGSYLGEDDIVRFDDDFGRLESPAV